MYGTTFEGTLQSVLFTSLLAFLSIIMETATVIYKVFYS